MTMARRGAVLRFLLACMAGGIAWAIAEILGGLAFLASGIRLWRYNILPTFAEITSPIVWVIAAILIVPLTALFDRAARTATRPPLRRVALRLAFMMAIGPLTEVLINNYVFVRVLGQPLYTYTVLPTFAGSGS